MSLDNDQTDLAYAGPGRQAALVRSREVHPRELVELYLRRIETHDARLNAFKAVLAEQAWKTADALSGTELTDAGPLAGVPIAVKDDMGLAGQTITYGSRSPAVVQSADWEIVARLRRAGAIPIGVTNVPELMAFPWTATAANGVTRNPWDTTRTPGGSSGGSAAAVAAGLVSAATGSDGGGSIRIPAACCGLVGMKSTRGLVPTAPHEELTLGLTVLGALARTVTDSALLLDVMAGSDRFAAAAASADPGRPLKIAISRKLPPGMFARLSADQRLAFDRTARLLEGLGHQVFERDPDYRLFSVEFTQTFFRGVAELYDELADQSVTEPSTRQLAAIAHRLVPPRRRDALRAKRPKLTARILKLWDEVDVLLMPVLSTTAMPAEGGYGKNAVLALDKSARFMPWNPLANMTGQPSIAIPAGFGADGLPLSVQLMGRPHSEDLLYALAAQIEAAKPWAQDRPAAFR
jgi:amidase